VRVRQGLRLYDDPGPQRWSERATHARASQSTYAQSGGGKARRSSPGALAAEPDDDHPAQGAALRERREAYAGKLAGATDD